MHPKLSQMDRQKNITEHYNQAENVDILSRNFSSIINIKNFNNFIKTVLLNKYAKKDGAVLDLGCGKGGDLKKYKNIAIKEYFGIDIAQNSLDEAKNRFHNMYAKMHGKFKCVDAYNSIWDLEKTFDLISCQFSFHYAFKDKQSFVNTVSLISKHCKPGGYFVATIPNTETLLRRYRNYGNNFGNKYYRVHFEDRFDAINAKNDHFGTAYSFFLEGAIDDCVEYLIDVPFMIDTFSKNGFEIKEHLSFLQFFNKNVDKNTELLARMIPDRLSNDELKVVELYSIISFQKTE